MSVFDRTLTHARTAVARARLGLGLQPLSERWGYDRGVSVHRRYITDFLEAHAQDVRGHVLEFNDPGYTREVGGDRVTKSDVVHLDDTNPQATIVADLTGPNTVPSDTFDCVIATHVLHVIFEPLTILRELHRILKPGGALLVAVPTVSMIGPEFPELWRFTPLGLRRLLEATFPPAGVEVRPYGNSLAAAAEIRGVVSSELGARELWSVDPRFTVEVCARAQKAPASNG
jgi:SAM-dependent methyltransferase